MSARPKLLPWQVLEIRANPNVILQSFADRFRVNVTTIWRARLKFTHKAVGAGDVDGGDHPGGHRAPDGAVLRSRAPEST
jgi:hypothetical protein